MDKLQQITAVARSYLHARDSLLSLEKRNPRGHEATTRHHADVMRQAQEVDTLERELRRLSSPVDEPPSRTPGAMILEFTFGGDPDNLNETALINVAHVALVMSPPRGRTQPGCGTIAMAGWYTLAGAWATARQWDLLRSAMESL